MSIGVKWIKGTHTLSLLLLKILVNLQLAPFFKFIFLKMLVHNIRALITEMEENKEIFRY